MKFSTTMRGAAAGILVGVMAAYLQWPDHPIYGEARMGQIIESLAMAGMLAGMGYFLGGMMSR